jgi:hypothetical protein
MQEAQGFFSKLNEKKNAASAIAEETIRKKAKEIADAPKPEREKLMALPGAMKVFLSVAVKKLATNDGAPAEVAAPKAVVSRPAILAS